MTETIAQRPPAMKVGGRRLSTTSRPKPHITSEAKSQSPSDKERPDYPRPAAPEQPHDPQQHPEEDHEEVPPKKEKKGHGALDHERRLQESLYRKAEQNRPTKDLGMSGKNTVGGGGRISQPAGKGIGA
ncbi:hypothetical protein NLI96_g1876 [Meripilus lineatus]|uniref:Uncharacterized protein n=1 Tax=Meripilus lineatus TaxID=2056292 RepID=A0AAD5VE22_9APHY|nr:hypothetical protein NLI96_g1876 [Physisporinus lineatus]